MIPFKPVAQLSNVLRQQLPAIITRTISVNTASLATITDIDANEVRADAAGMEQGQVSKIWHAVETLYKTGYYPAIYLAVRKRGKLILNRAIGHSQGVAPGQSRTGALLPASVNHPVMLCSASKAISALVIHKLEQDGVLNTMNAVRHYIPEFGQNGKANVTVHQLLSHRAGVPSLPRGVKADLIFDHDAMMDYLYQAEPEHLPGRKQVYHAITGGYVMVELVKRLTGMDMRAYWRKNFKEPMGLKTLDFGVEGALREQVVEQCHTGLKPLFPTTAFIKSVLGMTLDEANAMMEDPRILDAILPGSNIFGTAEEVGRFYQMMLDKGTYNGRQIVEPATVERAIFEARGFTPDGKLLLPLRFSAGFMLGGEYASLFGSKSHHAFGHLGYINKLTWADPERGTSVVLLTNGNPMVVDNIPALANLVQTINRETL